MLEGWERVRRWGSVNCARAERRTSGCVRGVVAEVEGRRCASCIVFLYGCLATVLHAVLIRRGRWQGSGVSAPGGAAAGKAASVSADSALALQSLQPLPTPTPLSSFVCAHYAAHLGVRSFAGVASLPSTSIPPSSSPLHTQRLTSEGGRSCCSDGLAPTLSPSAMIAVPLTPPRPPSRR